VSRISTASASNVTVELSLTPSSGQRGKHPVREGEAERTENPLPSEAHDDDDDDD